MEKLVYLYDENTGEYTGTYLAQKSPLDDNVFIMPIASTDIVPHDAKLNQVVIFKNGEWVIESDHRGEVWYDVDGKEIKIEEIGIIPNENWTLEKPIIPETPEQIIARLDNAIERHIHNVITGMGYVSIERLTGTYANSTNPTWKAESEGATKWITAIWEASLSIQDEVQSGLREVPTESELIALMPKLEDFVTY